MINYTYEPENKRVAAYLEDGSETGELTYYVREDGALVANHTFVDPSQRGKNIAAYMLDLFIEVAREAGVKIKPLCPYIVKAMVGKEEYADIVVE